MSIDQRKKRFFRKKVSIYIFILIFLIVSIFSFFLNPFSKDTLLSPLSKGNIDSSTVEEILKKNNISFASVSSLQDLSYKVNIVNNGEVRLSSKKDIEKQISSLQRILRELTIEGKRFKSINFMFSEPIISF